MLVKVESLLNVNKNRILLLRKLPIQTKIHKGGINPHEFISNEILNFCHERKLKMFKFGSDYQSDDENEIEIHFVDLSSDEDESDQEVELEPG